MTFGDQLVVGIQDRESVFPRSHHALDHQASAGFKSRNLPSTDEHEQQVSRSIGDLAFEVWRAFGGLDAQRADASGNLHPLSPLDVRDRDGPSRLLSQRAIEVSDSTLVPRSSSRRARV